MEIQFGPLGANPFLVRTILAKPLVKLALGLHEMEEPTDSETIASIVDEMHERDYMLWRVRIHQQHSSVRQVEFRVVHAFVHETPCLWILDDEHDIAYSSNVPQPSTT
jgi:hypothetical protein